MTIWLLAMGLLASLAALGYRQGVIRVAFSFVGIIVAVWLAGPLGGLTGLLLAAVGVRHVILLWLLPPFVAFVVVLVVFKIIGFGVQQRVEVHYKYKAGDLRYALWQRLSARLGLCLGLANAMAYLALISFVIYAFSYWTVQMSAGDEDPQWMRILNRMGRDLPRTGMYKVAGAIDPLPAIYYEAADLAGLIYHHPLLEARLARYPAFFSLAEKPYFQALGQDSKFADLRLKQEPINNLLACPSVETILKNSDTLILIWGIVAPDLQDLRAYLETGKSPKYDAEKIVGRWIFDVNGAIAAYRVARPNIPSSEMQKVKKSMLAAYAKTRLVAGPDHLIMLKNMPLPKVQAGTLAAAETQSVPGRWENVGGQYQLIFQGAGKTEEKKVQIEGARMTITGEGLPMSFTRDD